MASGPALPPAVRSEKVIDLAGLSKPLLERCKTLLTEIDLLRECIKQNRLPNVELRAFQSNVRSELRFLQAIGSRTVDEEKIRHALHSSNLRYFELVWNAAKASKGLLSILTQVQEGGIRPSVRQEKDKKTLQVEVIAQRGLQWYTLPTRSCTLLSSPLKFLELSRIKLSTISSERLILELAKAGFEGPINPDEAGEDEDPETEEWNERALASIPFVQAADFLCRAARNTWVDYQHPRILYMFQKVSSNDLWTSPIRNIFHKLETLGIEISFSDNLPSQFTLEDTLMRLKEQDLYVDLTDTLNIDCTILLALASDISNSIVHPEPRFGRAILRQLEIEAETPLLPSMLFPAFRSRKLVCTKHARRRFDEIVDEIGTNSEKERAALIGDMLEQDQVISEEKRAELINKFQGLSIHEIPKDWQLPIRTLPEEYMEGIGTPGSKSILEQLTPINRSVFGTGWKLGIMTVTSNATVSKLLNDAYTKWMEESGVSEKGPEGEYNRSGMNKATDEFVVWVLYTARSLVGKGWRIESTRTA